MQIPSPTKRNCLDSPTRMSKAFSASSTNFYDIIIIGAGISGLMAADVMLREQKKVLIIEESDYSGGLIYSSKLKTIMQTVPGDHKWILENEQIGETSIELGASQIATDHTYMLRLIEDLDLTIYSSYSDGKFIYGKSYQKIIQTQSLMDVYLTPEYKKTVLKLISKIQNISRNIKEAHENTISNPSRNYYKKVLKEYIDVYDSMSVEEFIEKEIEDQQLRKIVKNQFQTVESISTSKISVLQVFLHEYGLQNLKLFIQDSQYNFQNMRIKEGISAVINKLLIKVQKSGKKLGFGKDQIIRLNEKVLEIRNQINSEVQVITTKDSYRCFKVLFTASMVKANNIKISKLSQAKRAIFQNQLGGRVQKIFLFFETAFWRSRYSGQGVFSQEFPFNEILDCSPPNLSCGVLMLVLCADRVQKWNKKFGEYSNPVKKQFEMEAYMKGFIAKIFLNGNQTHHNLEKMALFHCYPKEGNFGYQTFTKSGVCSQLEANDDDYLESYSRDEHNILFTGSELSKKFGAFMQGAIRHARDKIFRYLEMVDPWKMPIN